MSGSWYCPQCGRHNIVATECWQCSTPRPGISAVAYRTPACDKHLSRNDEHECPWCKLDEYEHREKLHMDRCQHDMERIVALEQQNEALTSRLGAAEKAMREVVSHLQHSQRGSTHWAGCPDVHPACQAINMLVDALALEYGAEG